MMSLYDQVLDEAKRSRSDWSEWPEHRPSSPWRAERAKKQERENQEIAKEKSKPLVDPKKGTAREAVRGVIRDIRLGKHPRVGRGFEGAKAGPSWVRSVRRASRQNSDTGEYANMIEGAFRKAFVTAMGTPEKFGGSSEAEKQKEKERKKNSLGGLIKKAAKLTAKKLLLRDDFDLSRTPLLIAESGGV